MRNQIELGKHVALLEYGLRPHYRIDLAAKNNTIYSCNVEYNQYQLSYFGSDYSILENLLELIKICTNELN